MSEHSILTLSKTLNLIETIQIKIDQKLDKDAVQPFDFIIVLDFESTCWQDKSTWYQPEIIEFPAVLYRVKTGKIEAEFQQYVMPLENSTLSDFCKKLTGITQEQVDNGVPLGTCLMLFSKWLTKQTKKYSLSFPKQPASVYFNRCAFVTWSDWDLGICLNNECKRKQICKPDVFCQWIDLRAVYREFYRRKPKGLRGALSEVGLPFDGDEHCGLHDARNTALLAGRMIKDSVILKITKDLVPFNPVTAQI